MRRIEMICLPVAAAAAMLCLLLTAAGCTHTEMARPEDPVDRTSISLDRGDFRGAVVAGEAQLQRHRGAGDAAGQIRTLLALSDARQGLGSYRASLELLAQAGSLAEGAGDKTLTAAVAVRLGVACLYTERWDQAEIHLWRALELARDLADPAILSTVFNQLGNLAALQRKFPEALGFYREGLAAAGQAGDSRPHARVAANAARVSIQQASYAEAEEFLAAAAAGFLKARDTHDKAYGLVNVGQQYRQLAAAAPSGKSKFLSGATAALSEARATAERLDDHLAMSYAYGQVGALFEDEGDYRQADRSCRTAVLEAQRADAPESAYQWQWQCGRVARADGRLEDAVRHYRGAVETLQSIRMEMLADCRTFNQISFAEAVEPVYLGFVETLFAQADGARDPAAAAASLAEARRTIELSKTAEFQDYFQNACVVAGKSSLKRLDVNVEKVAVIYYVPLRERLEILLALPSGVRKATVGVRREVIVTAARQFRLKLEKRSSREYEVQARELYDWMIRPIEETLRREAVQTLVFSPDGPFRAIPMAALFDGKKFLVDAYAVVSTPAVSLTDFENQQRGNGRILIAGITESVQGFAPLKAVEREVRQVEDLFGGRVVENREFTAAALKRELEAFPYSIVHIASHGEFFDNSNRTFVLSWDGKLSVDDIEALLRVSKFRRDSVDLLALSACQTAGGDDKAALGLAGLSIKAGARSALASLWYINDEASSELVVEFYRNLRGGQCSKPEALRRAQLKIKEDDRYRHPGYWAPFLMIGSWS